MRTTLTIGILFTLFVLPPSAIGAEHAVTERRAVTHEDVWMMRRVDTPVPSPDGRWAVVSVEEPSYEEGGAVSDLWLVAVDGSVAPRRLTSTADAEADPAWSPDGRRLAFAAARGEAEEGEEKEPAQIYVLDMTGPGEAVRITSLVTGARAPTWSPDGQRLAFESKVYPGADDDAANQEEKEKREGRQYHVSAYDIFPVRKWDHWRDDLQIHLFVQDARPGAVARDLFAGSELVAELGFAGVPSRSSDELQAQWTPDGSALVFVATVNLHEAALGPVYYHLYRVSADGGAPERLTDSEEWTCTKPLFAPDFRALYCKYKPVNEYAYNLTRVARFDWPRGNSASLDAEPLIVTASFDRSVNDMTISADNRTLYVTANDEGRVRLFAAPAKGGNVKALDSKSRGVFKGPKAAGRVLVASWQDATHPAEVVRIDARSGATTALTFFNTERAAALDRRPFREFWHTSHKGRRVHSWLALPPGFDESKRYPLVLAIHGGPFSSSLDADHVRWSPHLLAAPGYVVLMTDYSGSVGYGEAFSRGIEGDPLKTPGAELLEAADEAIRLFPFIDGSRQAATGASYGGHLINWLQGSTERFRVLVGHAGLISLEGQWATSDSIYHREIMNGGPPWGDSSIWHDQSPSTYAGRFATPIMLTIGESDFRVPINQTLAAWTYTRRRNIPGRLLVFHEANHWIMNGPDARYFWGETHAWLGKYLIESEKN